MFWLDPETCFGLFHQISFEEVNIFTKVRFHTALMPPLRHTPKGGHLPGPWYDLNSWEKRAPMKSQIYKTFKNNFHKVLEIYQITKADQVY